MQYSQIYLGDRRQPGLTSGRPADRDWTNDGGGTHTLTASAHDDGLGGYSMRLDGAASGGGTKGTGCAATIRFGHCPYDWSTTFNYTLAEGVNNLSLTARDLAENDSPAQAWVQKIDRSAPTVSPAGPLWDDRGTWIRSDTTVRANASDSVSGVASVEFRVDGESVDTTSVQCSPGCSPQFTFRPEDFDTGPHSVSLIARDFAGNASTAASWTVKSDELGPIIDLAGTLVEADEQVVSEPHYNLGVEATDGADAADGAPAANESGVTSIDVQVDGQSQPGFPVAQSCSGGNCTFATPSDWQFTPADFPEGGHTITVLVGDGAGNVSTEELIVTVKHPQPSDTRSTANFDASRSASFDGAASGEQAGSALTSVGDLNGDGNDDYVVGAPQADFNGTNSGVAYLVYGTGAAGAAPLWGATGVATTAIYGGRANRYCGSAVAGVGDFTGDGHNDVAVGCPGSDATNNLGTLQGEVFIVPGGSSLQRFINLDTYGPAIRVSGPLEVPLSGAPAFGTVPLFGERIGTPLLGEYASGADVNGDGFDDLVIGAANEANNGRVNSGSTYVVFGAATSDDVDASNLGNRGFRIDGPANGSQAGRSVALAGDVDGDGLSEVVVGAPHASSDGSAYVVYGKASTSGVDLASLGTSGFQINGAAGDAVGHSIAALGDVDGDGLGEIALGADKAAYVVYGVDWTEFDGSRPPVDLGATTTYRGFRAGTSRAYGSARVAGAGDLNADAVPDLVLGFPAANAAAGSVFALYSPQGQPRPRNLDGLPGQHGTEITGADAGESFGASLAGLDVGIGGSPSILAGAPKASSGTFTDIGRARMFAASGLSGSGDPEASASGTSRCQPAGHPKAFTGHRSLPACRHTARGVDVDRSPKDQRSHYKMRRFMSTFSARQPIHDSFGLPIAFIRQVNLRKWEVFDQNERRVTPLGGVKGLMLIQGRACMREAPPGGAPVRNYALIGLEPGKGGYRGNIDPWLRGFIDESRIPSQAFFASNKWARGYGTMHKAISRFRTGCGKLSYTNSEPFPVNKDGSMFQSRDEYVGYRSARIFSYKPYSRPMLNSAPWPVNAPPASHILTLSASTTGVRFGGIVRAVVQVNSAAANPRQVDHIRYTDNNVPNEDNVPDEEQKVARWCRVKAGSGRAALVGWYPRRTPSTCGD